ncbi:metallopeptidase family protein [Demequina sp. B12]|uniref:metallopeptidase family protein n=1 Tax=Demequina sp. B12 TaxID=2992757 RepID=UPI00237AB851|nr:metallopeptidase family protein [Demequina sp. B12]MDE0573811.1 metallopeptidase family protein [Demequina sp. B12]
MGRRDRHGRGLRAPLLPYSAPAWKSRADTFDDYVREAASRLEPQWGKAWGKLEFGTEDVPPSDPTPWEDGIPLARLFPADMGQPARIVLYRRPMEQRAQGDELAQWVRDVVAENVAYLVGRRPEDIDPDYGG